MFYSSLLDKLIKRKLQIYISFTSIHVIAYSIRNHRLPHSTFSRSFHFTEINTVRPLKNTLPITLIELKTDDDVCWWNSVAESNGEIYYIAFRFNVQTVFFKAFPNILTQKYGQFNLQSPLVCMQMNGNGLILHRRKSISTSDVRAGSQAKNWK